MRSILKKEKKKKQINIRITDQLYQDLKALNLQVQRICRDALFSKVTEIRYQEMQKKNKLQSF